MKTGFKRFSALLLSAVMLTAALASCGEKKKSITVYASSEDFRIEMAQKMVNEKFPEYDVKIEYMSTGDLSAKMIAEGKDAEADIIYELENPYLEKISDNLATLDNVDYSVFVDSLVSPNHKYVPLVIASGAIIINEKMLEEKGLPVPESYDDLLKPEYKGLISMPNPKSSGTGYIFYLSMVNERGEEAALEYFDNLAENISGQGFTTSGSGPMQALKMGEAAIALGLTMSAATENSNGSDYTIKYFEEGAPYTVYSSAVIEGRQNDEDVMKVFNYIVSDVCPKDKELFSPEKIYKDRDFTIENYPTDINYADMKDVSDINVKEDLLNKWKY